MAGDIYVCRAELSPTNPTPKPAQEEVATMRNPCLIAFVAELERAGVTYTIEDGGRHIHVRWTCDGMARLVVVSRTPSGPGAPHNDVAMCAGRCGWMD
jgi:hypothetical protein